MPERRSARVVGTDDGGRTFTARAVTYGVVDDYNTRFVRGVFNDGLADHLPVIAWAHSWDEPIGRVTDWEERDDGLYITGRFSDPEAVPRARQAISQLSDGTLTDVSVGFSRLEDTRAEDGIVDITRAVLDEVSVVLRGAVPGAQVLSIRTPAGQIDEHQWLTVARKLAAGELTTAEAKAALTIVAETGEGPPVADPGDDDPGDAAAEAERIAELEALDAEAAATLAQLGL